MKKLMNRGFTLQKVEIFGIKNLARDNILKIVHSQNTSNIFDINFKADPRLKIG